MGDEQKKKKNIMLTSSEVNGRTPVGVNGVTIEVPHNKTVAVTEAEYEALQNAELGIVKLIDMPDDDDTTGDVRNMSADGGAKLGTEASPVQAPATPAATSTESNPLMDGGDGEEGLRGGDVELNEDSAGDHDADGDGPAAEKAGGNKPAGRAKGAGTAKSKANEGGRG